MTKTRIYSSTIILTLIIVMVYRLFDLTPLLNAQGGSNWPDAGFLLLLVVLVFSIVSSGSKTSILSNRMSLMVLFYLFLVGIEIVLATLYHGQSLKDGIVAAREQYFYLSFFLFLILLNDTGKLHQFLNTLTIVALVVFVLAVINYVGFHLFYSTKAENYDIIRAGVKRAFIPGFRLVSMVFIWQCARLLSVQRSDRLIPALFVIIFFAEHIFRQSRVPIISVLLAAIVMLIITRRYALMAKGGVFILVATLVTGVFMEKNIILDPFTSSVEEISSSEVNEAGSWNDRLKQIVFAWNEFKEHPWLGSGGVALRVSTFEGSALSKSEVFQLAYKSDLGYTQIIKSYGIVGTLWLVIFLSMMVASARRAVRMYHVTNEPLLLFAAAYTLYVIVSMVTLNHFMFSTDIVLLFLVVSILIRNDRNMLIEKKSKVSTESPVGARVDNNTRILSYRKSKSGGASD